jgi:hypothetical protein
VVGAGRGNDHKNSPGNALIAPGFQIKIASCNSFAPERWQAFGILPNRAEIGLTARRAAARASEHISAACLSEKAISGFFSID